MEVYINKKETDQSKERIKKAISKDSYYIDKKIKQGKQVTKGLILFYNQKYKINNFTNKDLLELINQAKKVFYKFSGFLQFTHVIGDMDISLTKRQLIELGKFHDDRKIAFINFFDFLDNVFVSYNKNSSIRNKKLNYLSLWEIEEFLNKRFSVSEINKKQAIRQKQAIVIYKNGIKEIIDNDYQERIAQILKKYIENNNISNERIIKGKSAYPGIITGEVVVANQKNIFKKACDNKILVISMTSPVMITKLKKIRAIITDEGGVLCHAAIIARELKKPCITSTKIASQVLKDGDRVRVDADQGIISIL